MKNTIAKQLAEASLPSPEQLDRTLLWDAIDTYLAALAHCPTCNGDGKYTTVKEQYPDNRDALRVGTELDCPTCAGRGFDPNHTSWACVEGNPGCNPNRQPEGHEDCSLRVSLPIPDKPLD